MKQADVKFHYTISETGAIRWHPTAKHATAWLDTHRLEHGVYVLAHHRDDAARRVGVKVAA